MIIKVVIGLVCFIGLLGLIGEILFIREMCRASEGYEDDKGFHVGKEPCE